MINTPAGKAERRAFQRAITLYTTDRDHNSAEAIAIMMRLALEAQGPITRRWAVKWLAARCNIAICDEGTGHATAPAAANL